jgi:hypothetical protein
MFRGIGSGTGMRPRTPVHDDRRAARAPGALAGAGGDRDRPPYGPVKVPE